LSVGMLSICCLEFPNDESPNIPKLPFSNACPASVLA